MILHEENLETLVAQEAKKFPGFSETDSRYLAVVDLLHRGMDELYLEVRRVLQIIDENNLPEVRQASIVRLTYLRAEVEASVSLFQEVATAGCDGERFQREALSRARVLALVKTASAVISRTLSTLSFLLSEEQALDRNLINYALIYFAKLSTLLGAAGNPHKDSKELADFIGLKSVAHA